MIFGVVVLLVFDDYIDMVMLASDEEFDFLLQSFGGNCAFLVVDGGGGDGVDTRWRVC